MSTRIPKGMPKVGGPSGSSSREVDIHPGEMFDGVVTVEVDGLASWIAKNTFVQLAIFDLHGRGIDIR